MQIQKTTIANTDYVSALKQKYEKEKNKEIIGLTFKPEYQPLLYEIERADDPSILEMTWYIIKNTPKFIKLGYYLIMFYLKLKEWICIKTGKQQ